ncbi:MAG: phosphoribosylformylglycinamidine cyclo-ligase [Deltaproteobacteria bacterium]|nr:phosphoribosylformylglycinamidine cyclo-ligase [Deltaproteobacteria bacterium]
MQESSGPSLTYRDAGVDIEQADAFVEKIQRTAQSTWQSGVLAGVGGFASAFSLADSPLAAGLKDPVLVSGTDGVGTKLKIAFALGAHSTIGIDLVAMCVNDVITTGAAPLFFLDYFGTGKLDAHVGAAVVAGIAEGCRQARCALVGGETAELPGLYRPGEYDLAGFAVGIVERSAMINGARTQVGDQVIGVQSRGLHSNGYSLAQEALLNRAGHTLDERLEGLEATLGEVLLTPTPIYADLARRLQARIQPKAIAHITGGGIEGNLPRVLPPGTLAHIHRSAWTVPPIFDRIAHAGRVEREEMFRTFNMGIGLCVVVSPDDAETALSAIADAGETGLIMGEIGPAAEETREAGVAWA